MNSIDELINSYIELEQEIGQLMSRLCRESCGMCTACCCRADICEEVADSAFLLSLLRKQGRSDADMDDRYGWLDVDGCSLEYGRPPICYAYFCDELLNQYPDEDAQYLIQVLGRLLYHIGENARNGQHLVEIGQSSELEQLDLSVIGDRIQYAQNAFDLIAELLESGDRLENVQRRFLRAIDLSEL